VPEVDRAPAKHPPGGCLSGFGTAAVLILILPLAGAAAAGKPLARFLQFPPKTPDIPHPPFSAPVFAGLALLVLAAMVFLYLPRRRDGEPPAPRGPARPFPWWGWAGLALGAAAWVVAWNRFPWMGGLQTHTFTPLWIAFIVVVNAFQHRRTGQCLLLSRTRRFLLLFPASAAFWWSFEYLNRFVGNWRYVGGAEFGPAEYFFFATLPFSTVLPAVLSVRELLLAGPRFDAAFRDRRPRSAGRPREAALAALLFSCAGLFAVGIAPDAVFPLVWVAPPLLLVALDGLRGRPHILSGLARGDRRIFVASTLAALVCGFFWEMWNSGSAVRWVYDIPYVDAFHLFEMPILGYAGYLPFGALCAQAGDRLAGDEPCAG